MDGLVTLWVGRFWAEVKEMSMPICKRAPRKKELSYPRDQEAPDPVPDIDMTLSREPPFLFTLQDKSIVFLFSSVLAPGL